MADMIVLGGCAAVEYAAHQAGMKDIVVPFTPGRTDATEEETDVASFEPLELVFDGFRNYERPGIHAKAEEELVNRAHLLGLSAPEMTVLVGGLRVLQANHSSSRNVGVFTKKPETLTNDFFVNLLDMNVEWKAVDTENMRFEGLNRNAKKSVPLWTASRVDLIFGHHSELRAIAEFYACDDAKERFVHDFVKAWVKVMENDLIEQ